MKLKLVREAFTDKSTIGSLSVDGVYLCHTLEDVVRDVKIAGETCIPFGSYQVIINRSERFKRDMPLLMNVPGFSGIRIHPGNTDADTHGCILVGLIQDIDKIEKSREAFDTLFNTLNAAFYRGETITISIEEPDGN